MNDNIDWDLVKVFLAVARGRTLTGAAQALGTSQPTVGRQIRDLEMQLGVPLVVRHSRGVSLTAQGEALLATAQAIDAQMHALVRQAKGRRGRLEGSVRISATEMVGVYILMPALARLRVAYPGIHLELDLDNSATDLLQGDADIAVRMFRPQQMELVGRRVGFIATGFFAGRSYADLRGLPEDMDGLFEHDLVGYDRHPVMVRAMPSIDPRLTREAIGFKSDSMLAQLEAIRQGAGIGVLQLEVARRFPELVRVLPQVRLPRLDMWLVTHPDVRGGAHVHAVFEGLVRDLIAYSDMLGPLVDGLESEAG